MTSDGSAGNSRDGFEAWVASLQRPPGAGAKPSEPDLTSALVDNSATHVQQIPKELIHRLRERETQGLLGVEVERTAIFKPPPELLARAKRMRPPSKPASPSEAPAAEPSEVPTAPPPPEAAVPTVRPPPPGRVNTLDDGWAELVEPGLDALKPITPRSAPAPRLSHPSHPSRPVAPAFVSTASRAPASPAPRPVASHAPASNRTQASGTPVSSHAPASNRTHASDAPGSGSARPSRPGPAVVVARTVAVVKSADAGPPPAAPAPLVFDLEEPDEPTRIRADGYSGLLGVPPPAPSGEGESEGTEPRLSGVVLHTNAPADAPTDANIDANIDAPAYDSISPGAVERGASGRHWVVIAALFLSLVVIALAALKR